jgi:hypothetical protein
MHLGAHRAMLNVRDGQLYHMFIPKGIQNILSRLGSCVAIRCLKALEAAGKSCNHGACGLVLDRIFFGKHTSLHNRRILEEPAQLWGSCKSLQHRVGKVLISVRNSCDCIPGRLQMAGD